MKNPFDHVCGLQGFGHVGDACPACLFHKYLDLGYSENDAIEKATKKSGISTRAGRSFLAKAISTLYRYRYRYMYMYSK